MGRGRNMSDHVRHEDRECAKHGRTLHSLYYVGPSMAPIWFCLCCERERQRLYKARKAAGGAMRPRAAANEPQSRPAVCPVCFLVLTASGVCPDECTS